MRVLLDENLPRKLKYRFRPEHEAVTVTECGWSGVKNGELLRRASTEFDALITMDRGFEYQQKYAGLTITIIVLHAPSNDYDDLLPLIGSIKAVLTEVAPGLITHVST